MPSSVVFRTCCYQRRKLGKFSMSGQKTMPSSISSAWTREATGHGLRRQQDRIYSIIHDDFLWPPSASSKALCYKFFTRVPPLQLSCMPPPPFRKHWSTLFVIDEKSHYLSSLLTNRNLAQQEIVSTLQPQRNMNIWLRLYKLITWLIVEHPIISPGLASCR